jgi:mannose PTS system EIIA component
VGIIKVLLVSHGYLAKEMLATVKMIFGDVNNIAYLELPYGCDLSDYKSQIAKYINESEDGLLILADLFGGTPFMISSQLFCNEEYNKKIELVTGMNLGMVLEVVSKIDTMNIQELKELAISSGMQGICDLREQVNK